MPVLPFPICCLLAEQSGDSSCLQVDAVYTLQGSYSDLQAAYNEITANIPYPIRFAMPFEEYIDYSEENPESGSTKIYIPIKL